MWKDCPVFASFTLASALQLRKKHGKTSVRLRKTSVRVRKTLSQGKIQQRSQITKSVAIGALLAQFCAERVFGFSCVDRESHDGIAQLLKHLHPPTALQHLYGATRPCMLSSHSLCPPLALFSNAATLTVVYRRQSYRRPVKTFPTKC
jgi:hypothetical protein